MTEFDIFVAPDGSLRFVYDDALAPLLGLGKATIRRASHVGPSGTDWWADLGPVGGPRLGPFRLRSEALAAEYDWLLKNGVPFPEGR